MFWNIARRKLAAHISAAAREHDVDFVVLAECDLTTKAMLEALRDGSALSRFDEVSCPPGSRVRLFTRMPAQRVQIAADDGKISIRRLRLAAGDELLLVAVHLASKLRAEPEDQRLGA